MKAIGYITIRYTGILVLVYIFIFIY